ncbi:Inositol 2-dehydrogenase/D-chiro-inositol 3-dehydrogenase [Paenibacillus sp. CECT 9249]|uniref:Gfo/Idh/MocA family protein n=1 Tax=Paenibacillus sp. CECT 9249 TaxID=2845385 RepID=UPI001E498995|nr:Gfo/Idh/MocA family oxidoreductase [Paenibacillus sp. CECT 9249]CAH0121272.1 Inositol 2-dehydrogenase/D-chiro-inositol 3-dehydrogenase [Paenibacillus sp. CECT 9249]
MLKVGIIGAGFMAKTHADVYERMANVEIAAFAEGNEAAGQETAKRYRCRYYSTAEEMLRAEEIQWVDICVPTFLHEKFAVMAARAGKHIMCEKPLTLTLEAAGRIYEEADKAGVKLLVGQVLRFWPEYQAMKRICDEGRIGNVEVVRAERLAQTPNWSGWFQDVSKSGGALFDLHLHDIDFMRHLLGPVESVYAIGRQSANGAWDQIATSLSFRNGSKASIECSNQMAEGFPFTMALRANGTGGTLDFRYAAGHNLETRDSAAVRFMLYRDGRETEVTVERQDAFQLELEHFIDCIGKNRMSEIVPPAEVREVLGIMESIRTSLETGRVQML